MPHLSFAQALKVFNSKDKQEFCLRIGAMQRLRSIALFMEGGHFLLSAGCLAIGGCARPKKCPKLHHYSRRPKVNPTVPNMFRRCSYIVFSISLNPALQLCLRSPARHYGRPTVATATVLENQRPR